MEPAARRRHLFSCTAAAANAPSSPPPLWTTCDDRKNLMYATWLQYCQKNIPIKPNFTSNSELVHYFYARVLHRLGDDGYAKLFPKSKAEERLTWSRYRTVMFDHLQETQDKDGSWKLRGWGPSPVFAASLFLSILQLDNEPLALSPR